jgi:hypothetical protein
MDKSTGRHARCLVLVVDTSIESQSPDFNKLCNVTFNALALEFAKRCREKEVEIRFALVAPFDVNGCQWLERMSEWHFARKKLDEIVASRSSVTSVSLGGQLERLLSSVKSKLMLVHFELRIWDLTKMPAQEIIESNNLIDVVWLTSGSIPADSSEEVDFWKVVRRVSKFTHVSVRIVCELGFSKSDYVGIWKDRLNADLISVSPEDLETRDGVPKLSTADCERIFCCDVRWRVFVRCVSNPELECDNSHARMRVSLLDKITSSRYAKGSCFFANSNSSDFRSVDTVHRHHLVRDRVITSILEGCRSLF